jgi:type IX secretion system substrate protein
VKTTIYILVFLLIAPFSWGQSLKIVDSQLNLSPEVGSYSYSTIKIQNVSDHIILLGVKRTLNNIRSSQLSKFCINNDCTNKNIVTGNTIIKLLPGEIFDGFSVELQSGLVPGNSSVKFLFYNLSNTNESVEAEINYTVKEKVKDGILFASSVVQFSDVFPNPVREKAIFNYTYFNPEKEARLVIHSVLGSVISEFDLSPYESQLSIPVENYNPGVYFYTLYIDNEGVATKKMVIRK